MKTLFLLIVLTQNGAGDNNVSFVNASSLEQCQQKASMVEGVFVASNIPVIESSCIQSRLRFSEFRHASTSSKIKHFYLLMFEGQDVQIEKMTDWKMCTRRVGLVTEPGRVYCASSVQFVGG